MTLLDIVCLGILAVATALFLLKMASLLDIYLRPSDSELEQALKRANDELNNRPRI